MSHRIKLSHCHPLKDDIAADTTTPPPGTTHTAHPLPHSFPSHLLDDDQLTAVEDWWSSYLPDILDRLRAALTLNYGESHGGNTQRDGLEQLAATSLVLAHLLNLHPAAHNNLSTLAKWSHRSKANLFELKRNMVAILRGDTACDTARSRRTPRLRDLMKDYRQLDWQNRSGNGNILIVPFTARHTLVEQWDTVLTLASLPHISATLDIDSTGRDAIRITFH